SQPQLTTTGWERWAERLGAVSCLPKADELVRLNAQAPAWVTQAVVDSELGVACRFGSVHWLQKEMLEIQPLEFLRRRVVLRIHQLELVSVCLHEGRAGLRTHADPIK